MDIERKDNPNGNIILFVIGVLLGAVIATAAFLICAKTLGVTEESNSGQSSQMQGGGTPPEMPSGENGNSGEQPPEKPSDDNSRNNSN